MPDFLPFWFLPLACALFGACIGSFLNVVIYRVPRGISINSPARSFCPECKTPIPWSLNIPVVSWLWLKGKCRSCGMSIPKRYWLAEVMTALLFGGIAWANPDQPILSIAFICLWCAIGLAVAWIDAENMLVYPSLTLAGTLFGLVAVLSGLDLLDLSEPTWDEALISSLFGAITGYILIRGIIVFGRILFGKWSCDYPEGASWELVEPADDMDELLLRLPDRDYGWSHMFSRPGDAVLLQKASIIIDGEEREAGDWVMTEESLVSPTGETIPLADIHSARGTVSHIDGRREAMGGGDAWIMMMIGSLCGWQGVLFSLFIGSIFGIITGIAARRSQGQPIPFGPSLLAAAFIWVLGGHALWSAYVAWVMG